jgi:SAM-dependent methyltransferase
MRYDYLQYGCGWSAPKGWRNFDSSPALRFERFPLIGRIYTKNESRFPMNAEFGDIVSGLPVPSDSCRGVYCSHVIEHLSLEDSRKALKNTYKIMRNGGTFRLVLPDLKFYAKQYVSNTSDDAAIAFMKDTSLGLEHRTKGFKNFLLAWLGNSRHLWMWDYKSLALELHKAGFIGIRRAYYGDASDARFNEVEVKQRWKDCLGIECQKPS